MKHLWFIISLLLANPAAAQDRYLISVGDLNSDIAQTLTNNNVIFDPGKVIQRPDLGINILGLTLDQGQIANARNAIQNTYAPDFVFSEDLPAVPTSGGAGGLCEFPITPNLPLIDLVPGGPIGSPPTGELTADLIIDIIGTGVDINHPDFVGLTFLPGISAIPDSGVGFLSADYDYHDHETRVASCISGDTSGLLTQLGTRFDASYRSVLFYEKSFGGPSFAYAVDCIDALTKLIDAHKDRLEKPYLKNHASVVCFSHSIDVPNVRVGDIDELMTTMWELGMFTSISAGNDADTAAAVTPAGAGEWITYKPASSEVNVEFWPPSGTYTYDLPLVAGFKPDFPRSTYHLKTGAHDSAGSPSPWFVATGTGSNLNTLNPLSLTPATNTGVDLFAPGTSIPVAATHLTYPATTAETIEIDGTIYDIEQGYTTGDGTSYSAAYSAALAARILQIYPWATPDQVRTAILDASTADSPPPPALQILSVPTLTGLDMRMTFTQWMGRYKQIIAGIDPSFFDGGLDGKLADPDNDGVTNLVEYLCGMDPRHPDNPLSPKITFDADTSMLTVTMQLAEYLHSTDTATWDVQYSTDLSTWTTVTPAALSLASETSHNGDGLTGTWSTSYSSTTDNLFYRVRVTYIP